LDGYKGNTRLVHREPGFPAKEADMFKFKGISARVAAAAFLLALFVPSGSALAGLADLVVSDAKLKSNCKLDIYIRNMGDGLPRGKAFTVRIQAVKDNKGAGGWLMPVQNKNGELSTTGGELMFHFFPLTIQGEMSVQIDVDHFRRIPESNEDNNRMLRTFTCGVEEETPKPKKVLKRRLYKRPVNRRLYNR
jgi:hypothetical protein